MDSLALMRLPETLIKKMVRQALPMTRAEFKKYLIDSQCCNGRILILPRANINQKQNMIRALEQTGKKHNWLERQLIYKNIEINEKYKDNTRGAWLKHL